MCNHIAVYGSLRVGQPANHLMQGCDFVTDDEIKGTLYNLGPYPGVRLGTKDQIDIKVDVYELPADEREVMARLDRYEGYDKQSPEQSLFVRKKTLTKENEEVWVYEFNSEPEYGVEIKNGDWVDHVNTRNKLRA